MSRYWLAVALLIASCRAAGPVRTAADPPRADYLPLGFDDLLQEGGAHLEPTAKLLAADGKRVRVVGFMAQMEQPPPDGFYLTRRPLFCDEGGGGTGDLPPDAIRVQVIGALAPVPFIPGPLEVVGILQVGAKEHPDRSVSHIRILLRGDKPSGVTRGAGT
jgi:hypothetical protein